jgi:hypothetical protein
MIFLTVGTQFPFDRLVKAVDHLFDEGLMPEEVFGQIGVSTYKPRHFETVVSLEKNTYDDRFQQASAVISHAGMGAITMALDQSKPLLVMARPYPGGPGRGAVAGESGTAGVVCSSAPKCGTRGRGTEGPPFSGSSRANKADAVIPDHLLPAGRWAPPCRGEV